MENEDDPNFKMKSIIRKKFTRTVSKVKNILRWSFSKKNFLEGMNSNKSLPMSKSIEEGQISPHSKPDEAEGVKTTKVKLFSKK